MKVFGSKDACFKCRKPKSEVEKPGGGGGNGSSGRPNDWRCKECRVTVFGSRRECFKCHKPKSEVEDKNAE